MKYNCIESVKADLQEQSDMLQQLESRKSQLIQFDGCTLKIKNSGGSTYYHCRENPAHPWLYLGNEDHPDVRSIQELRYCNEAIPLLKNNIALEENLLANYRAPEYDSILNGLPKTYIPAKGFPQFDGYDINKYFDELVDFKNSIPPRNPEFLKFQAIDGTLIRSRGEVIMYDRFWQRGYHPLYEFPFRLANGKFLFPDFLLIHPQIPYLYIVEHLGLWFHPEMKDNYRKNYLLKEEAYRTLGFTEGVNLFTTKELPDGGIDLETLERMCTMIMSSPPSSAVQRQGLILDDKFIRDFLR